MWWTRSNEWKRTNEPGLIPKKKKKKGGGRGEGAGSSKTEEKRKDHRNGKNLCGRLKVGRILAKGKENYLLKEETSKAKAEE